jgi:hypothetical protein
LVGGRAGRTRRRISWWRPVVELEYAHEGAEWRQGYWLVPLGQGRSLVVTAQAPAARAEETMRAGDLVAGSVRPG